MLELIRLFCANHPVNYITPEILLSDFRDVNAYLLSFQHDKILIDHFICSAKATAVQKAIPTSAMTFPYVNQNFFCFFRLIMPLLRLGVGQVCPMILRSFVYTFLGTGCVRIARIAEA